MAPGVTQTRKRAADEESSTYQLADEGARSELLSKREIGQRVLERPLGTATETEQGEAISSDDMEPLVDFRRDDGGIPNAQPSPDSFHRSQPSRKRQKKHGGTRQVTPFTVGASLRITSGSARPASQLHRLNQMPWVILSTVAQHLHPQDLLNIGRVDHNWQNKLLSRQAAPVWSAARANVDGLPECPNDLNEMEYARLLFETDCYECNDVNVPKAYFALRVRFCDFCADEFLSDRTALNSRESKLVPYTTVGTFIHGHISHKEYYSVPFLEGMQTKMKEKRGTSTAEDYRKWKADQRAIATEITTTGRVLEAWFEDKSGTEAGHVQTILRERERRIKERLVTLGYTVEDITTCWDEDIVYELQEFSESVWETIFMLLQPNLDSARKQREESAERERRGQRHNELLPLYENFKNVTDCPSSELFGYLPSVHPLWLPSMRVHELQSSDFPPLDLIRRDLEEFIASAKQDLQRRLDAAYKEEMVSRFDLIHNVATLNSFKKDCLRSGVSIAPLPTGQVKNMVLESRNIVRADPYPRGGLLELATSAFFCSDCNEALLWPAVLRHPCVGKQFVRSGPSLSRMDPINGWVFKKLRVSKASIIIMRAVLRVLGLGSISVKANCLPTNGSSYYRIECLACEQDPFRVHDEPFSAWQQAVSHYMTCCISETKWLAELGKLPSTESRSPHLLFLYEQNELFQRQELHIPAQYWMCVLCQGDRRRRHRLFIEQGLEKHLMAKHKIPNTPKMGEYMLEAPSMEYQYPSWQNWY